MGVRVSADIFDYAASVPAVEGIGQDFTASWLGRGHDAKYGQVQVEDQIRALKDMMGMNPLQIKKGWLLVRMTDAVFFVAVQILRYPLQ